MGLPTAVSDLPYPPGNSWSVRGGADDIRSTLARLGTARTAAEHLEAITSGAHWRGEAFEAFRRATEVKPLPAAVDHAAERMVQAADRLDWFADRFDANADTIRWCRSRLSALAIEGGSVPDELVPEVQRIQWDVERAWDDHRAALSHVADLFDWLDDQPIFATPPPSNWDRVKGAAGHVWSFGVGVVEATWAMVTLSAELMLYLNPLTAPFKWREAWENRDQIVAILQFAWDNPGDFAVELGKAVLDLDTLREDGVARWLGHRVPDIVLALATGGLGSVGTGAAMSVRGLRGARAATAVVDKLGMTRFFKPLQAMDGATDAANSLGRSRVMNRLNRLGADAGRLDRMTDLGAFARSDTTLGRLATRLDRVPLVERLRQLPGAVNDEIKGFTHLPSRFLQQRFEGVPFVDNLSPTVQRRFDSIVTHGLTGGLGIVDGLTVGAPALSPQTQVAMAGVLGASAVSELGSMVDIGGELAADAAVAGHR